MTQKIWNLKKPKDHDIITLEKELAGTRPALCRLFAGRGLNTYKKVQEFFTHNLARLHSPWRMKGMQESVQRIIKAFQNREKILLVGDYDVDGTASIAMMYRFLKENYSGEQVFYYIPDRYKEGYGLSREAVDYALGKGVSLIITLDCGITSNRIIDQSSQKWGLDYIICDHHLPGTSLPAAFAILNPKQPGCDYPFKDLCGCGVAFKLITALGEQLNIPSGFFYQYLDLVVLATGADLVSVLGENRTLCYYGLEKLNKDPGEGIRALKATNPDVSNYTLEQVVFLLAPKINAAGRMLHGKLAVELLIEDDPKQAQELAQRLLKLNETRKEVDKSVTAEALILIEDQKQEPDTSTTVVFKEGWHKGVLGIVASRLVETYYKPTIVFTSEEDTVTGSARSVPGFNIYDAIHDCREYLLKFGGHTAAAGLTLSKENVQPFRKKFEDVAHEMIAPEPHLSIPQIEIDSEITLSDIDYSFYNTIARMEPFGQQNPNPVFIIKNIKMNGRSRVAGHNHALIVFDLPGNKHLKGIGFGLKEKFIRINRESPIDVVFNLVENNWNNRKTLQLRIIDLKASTSNLPNEP